jgi:hypothetical protein
MVPPLFHGNAGEWRDALCEAVIVTVVEPFPPAVITTCGGVVAEISGELVVTLNVTVPAYVVDARLSVTFVAPTGWSETVVALAYIESAGEEAGGAELDTCSTVVPEDAA